jgi:GrpB-like predicted nucleotidyltransferase (UPF0157 family)
LSLQLDKRIVSLNPATVISILDYDTAWPKRFERLATRVRAALGELVARVDHVGSTAVPGLAAKPIIDLDIVVPVDARIQPIIGKLAQIGYVHQGDLGVAGREAFYSPAGEDQHHLYLLVDGALELKRHLAFRDALRADSELREAYAQLKRSLAAQHPNNKDAYVAGKTDFVTRVLAGSGAI